MTCSGPPQDCTQVALAHGPDGIALIAGEVLPENGVSAAPPPLHPSIDGPVSELARLWASRGPAALRAADGPFACAIRDADALYLYRDPSGLRSLFALPAGSNGGAAATCLSALVPVGSERAEIDRRSVHQYLRLLDIAAPDTIIAGAQAVMPGQILRLAQAHCTEAQTGASPLQNAPPAEFDQALASLEELLRASVVRALANARRAGAFLSGGVDSALVCALAARGSPDLTAVTVGFEGPGFDEAPVAARVAVCLGVRHAVLRFSRDDYLRAFDRLARGMDQPMADPASMATLLTFEHCREHFDVVLDGTGADEAVGAMPPRHVRMAVEFGSQLPGSLRRGLVRAMSRVPKLAGYTPLLDFEHPAATLMRWKGFTRSEIEELCGEPVSLEHTTFYRTYAHFPRSAHYERYSALINAMPSDRLTQALRLTGACVRFPFCAQEVDSFLRQLPTEWRYLPGQPKRILRELLARYVPREIWDAPKHGFDFPLHDFLSGNDHTLVRQHVLEGRWLTRGLLRPEVVRRYALAYIGGDRRLMFRVWALVVLGAWLDAHEDLIIPPPRA